jgi:hypothetical protein
MLQIMPILDLFPGRNTWDPEETRNASFWLMKAPRYGPFLHGEWRQLFLSTSDNNSLAQALRAPPTYCLLGPTPLLHLQQEQSPPIDRRQILHPPDRNLQQIVLPHTHTHERQQRLRPSKGCDARTQLL